MSPPAIQRWDVVTDYVGMGNVRYINFRRRSRVSWGWTILALFIGLSGLQYRYQGEVTWVTQAFQSGEGYLNRALDSDIFQSAARTQAELSSKVRELSPIGVDLSGKVTSVKDGDTFVLRDANGKSHTIRLQGVDTPEKNQPHGRAATRFLSKRIKGEQVQVQVHGKGYYGRTIGTVYVDGANVNVELVCSGHAWWYKRYAPTNLELASCERSARKNELGLWADSNPVAPWIWRRS